MGNREGNRPAGGTLLAETTGFELWICGKVARDAVWRNLKLVKLDPDPVKANWWIAWSPAESRMANGKDWVLLREHRPSVASWVESACRKWALG